MIERSKVGVIEVSDNIYQEFWCQASSEFIPYDIKFDYLRKVFTIECVSNHFKSLSEGENIPKYVLEFQRIPFFGGHKVILTGVE